MSNLNIILQATHFPGVQTNDPADTCKIKNTSEDPNITGFLRVETVITDSTVDQAIPLPDANSNFLFIFTDREVSIKLNGSGDPLTLTPRSPGVKDFVYFHKGALTAVLVSNASGTDAKLDIMIANKA